MVHARCVLLALAAALALATANTALEQQAERIIEEFRATMPTGRPDIYMPVLEPAVIEELPVTVKLFPFDATCVASRVSVAGVSGFVFTQLEQIEGTNTLAVSVELPDIDVSGLYDLKGKVKVGLINVKLNGEGPLKVTLHGLKGSAMANLLINEDGSLNLADLKINSWTYDKITIKLEHLFNGGVIGNTVNSLVNKLVPRFVESNRNKIDSMVETMGKQIINQYLDGIAGRAAPAAFIDAEDAPLTLADDEWTVSAEAQEILHQLAATSLRPAGPWSPAVVDIVRQLLEDFRAIMPTGCADLNIPVLDPAVIKRLPVDVEFAPFDLQSISTDVHVAGVSDFKIVNLTRVPRTNNQLYLSIEVPEVVVNGRYELNGKVKIGFNEISINAARGPVSLKMKGFKGTATLDMIVNSDASLNLNWVRFDTWHFDDVKAELGNLFMGKIINQLINRFIPLFLEIKRGWINNWGEKVALTLVNQYLDSVNGREPRAHTEALQMEDLSIPMATSAEIQEILDQLALVLAARPRQAALLGA